MASTPPHEPKSKAPPRIPLLNKTKYLKNREVAEKDRAIQQAGNSVREAESQVLMEVSGRFRTLHEACQLLRVSRLAQTAARANVQLASYKFRAQAALLKDVLQAQNVIRQRQLRLSEHFYSSRLVSGSQRQTPRNTDKLVLPHFSLVCDW